MATDKQQTTSRKVKIGKIIYQVEGVFGGETKIGPKMEKMAEKHVLAEIDRQAKLALSA